MTQEEIDGICEIWIIVPNKRPGLGIPVRAALSPDQVEGIKKLLSERREPSVSRNTEGAAALGEPSPNETAATINEALEKAARVAERKEIERLHGYQIAAAIRALKT